MRGSLVERVKELQGWGQVLPTRSHREEPSRPTPLHPPGPLFQIPAKALIREHSKSEAAAALAAAGGSRSQPRSGLSQRDEGLLLLLEGAGPSMLSTSPGTCAIGEGRAWKRGEED